MADPRILLAQATQQGYVVIHSGESLVWRYFYAWCLAHARPYVYVDLRRTVRYNGAVVAIDLFTTSDEGRGGDRFPPPVLVEAEQVLATYPTVKPPQSPMRPRVSPISIWQAGVPVDQAEALAQELLALYRRMKAADS